MRRLVDEDFMRPPVLDLEGRSTMDISFDILGDEERWVSYRITHCTADWLPSDISELDYVEGFQPVRVTSVAASFNTFVPYYHYAVRFPNDDVRLRLSGNYAVEFFYDDTPDATIAVATFSLLEPLVAIEGGVSANTDIDYRSRHQQVACTLSWAATRFPHVDPASEFTLKVRQNGRRDTERTVTRPDRMHADRAFYEHCRDLIFAGGNNFRRFEFTDADYSSIGVEWARYHAPYYYVRLTDDGLRAGRTYSYDRDQHGRYLVHALRVDDVDTEADYFLARFTLTAPPRLATEGVWLMGAFTYGTLNETTQMIYDPDEQRFQQTMLLKQGAYNYMYVVGDTATPGGLRTAPIEGDYYETPNEYSIAVYYRPVGGRYDRLVGFARFEPK